MMWLVLDEASGSTSIRYEGILTNPILGDVRFVCLKGRPSGLMYVCKVVGNRYVRLLVSGDPWPRLCNRRLFVVGDTCREVLGWMLLESKS